MNKTKLVSDLTTLYNATLDNGELTPEQAKQKFIQELAAAIEDYVKSAQINYVSGLVASTYLVTGTFNGNLS